MTDPNPRNETEDTERLRNLASWWSGWCTDNDSTLPELATLGGLLLDLKHALDVPVLSRNQLAAIVTQARADGRHAWALHVSNAPETYTSPKDVFEVEAIVSAVLVLLGQEKK